MANEYAGPVPLGTDVQHFRETGITRPSGGGYAGPVPLGSDVEHFRRTGETRPSGIAEAQRKSQEAAQEIARRKAEINRQIEAERRASLYEATQRYREGLRHIHDIGGRQEALNQLQQDIGRVQQQYTESRLRGEIISGFTPSVDVSPKYYDRGDPKYTPGAEYVKPPIIRPEDVILPSTAQMEYVPPESPGREAYERKLNLMLQAGLTPYFTKEGMVYTQRERPTRFQEYYGKISKWLRERFPAGQVPEIARGVPPGYTYAEAQRYPRPPGLTPEQMRFFLSPEGYRPLVDFRKPIVTIGKKIISAIQKVPFGAAAVPPVAAGERYRAAIETERPSVPVWEYFVPGEVPPIAKGERYIKAFERKEVPSVLEELKKLPIGIGAVPEVAAGELYRRAVEREPVKPVWPYIEKGIEFVSPYVKKVIKSPFVGVGSPTPLISIESQIFKTGKKVIERIPFGPSVVPDIARGYERPTDYEKGIPFLEIGPPAVPSIARGEMYEEAIRREEVPSIWGEIKKIPPYVEKAAPFISPFVGYKAPVDLLKYGRPGEVPEIALGRKGDSYEELIKLMKKQQPQLKTAKNLQFNIEEKLRKKYGDLIQQFRGAETFEQQKAIARELELKGAIVWLEKTKEGIFYKYKIPEAEEYHLRPDWEAKTVPEATTKMFFRLLGEETERVGAEIFQRTVFIGPGVTAKVKAGFVPLQPAQYQASIQPTSEYFGKGLRLGAEIGGFVAVPGYAAVRFVGPTAETLITKPKKIITFAKEEPFEVGMAATYGIFKGAKYLRKPIVTPLIRPKPIIKAKDIIQPIIGKEKRLDLGMFRATRYIPKWEAIKTTRLGKLLRRKPEIIKLQKSRLDIIWTPEPMISKKGVIKEAFFLGKKVPSKYATLFEISGMQKTFPIEKFKQLPKTQQYILKKLVEEKIGRPIALKFVPKFIRKDLEAYRGLFVTKKLGRVYPKVRSLFYRPFEPGKRITRQEIAGWGKILKVPKEKPYKDFLSLTGVKEITKPLPRMAGKVELVPGISRVLKPIDITPKELRIITVVPKVKGLVTEQKTISDILKAAVKVFPKVPKTKLTLIKPTKVPSILAPSMGAYAGMGLYDVSEEVIQERERITPLTAPREPELKDFPAFVTPTSMFEGITPGRRDIAPVGRFEPQELLGVSPRVKDLVKPTAKPKTLLRRRAIEKERLVLPPKPAIRPAIKPAIKPITKIRPLIKTAPQLRQEMEAALKLGVGLRTRMTQVFQRPRIHPKVPFVFPKLKIPKKKVKKKKKLIKKLEPLFIPEIRRKGKWFPITPPTTKAKAIKLGKRKVLETLGVSLRVKEYKTGKLVPLKITSEIWRRAEKEPGIIIQKKYAIPSLAYRGRLTTLSERREIQIARKSKPKKRKKSKVKKKTKRRKSIW